MQFLIKNILYFEQEIHFKKRSGFFFVFFPLLVFSCLFGVRLNAQTFRILDVDAQTFPQIKASIFCLDSNLNAYRDLNESDFVIYENGVLRKADSLICPSPSETHSPISSALAIDVSESMYSNSGLKIARAAAREWVRTKQVLPFKEEIAITSFSDFSNIETDFTENKQVLNNKIDSVRIQGGTNFTNAFLDPKSGILELFKAAKYSRRVLVFLTDGNGVADADNIIKKAKEYGVLVFCVSVNFDMAESLKKIATATGGRYFNNITTEEDIIAVYRIIRKMAENQGECQLYWRTSGCLQGRDLQITIPKYNLQTEYKFQSPDSLLPMFKYIPNEFYVFDGIAPLSSGSKTIEVKAERSAIRVDSIKSDNPLFYITSYLQAGSLPITLSKGQSIKFNVEFSPKDSAFTFATFKIYGTSCISNEFYCVGGNPGVPPANSSLIVTHPKGGEELLVNSNSFITWSGVYTEPNVKIDLSINNGRSWVNLKDNFQEKEYQPWVVPNLISDSCLIKVSQYSTDVGRKILDIDTKNSSIENLDWSPDGNFILLAASDSTIKVISSVSGKLLYEWKKHKSPVSAVTWGADAVRFASGGSDSLVRIWNFFVQRQIDSIYLQTDKVLSLDWSSDGKFIAVAAGDSSVRIYNSSDYTLANFIKTNSLIYSVKFSHNSSMLAIAGTDKEVSIYSTKTWSNKLYSFKGHNISITSIAWRGDDKQIVSVSDSPEFLVKIWDLTTGAEYKSYSHLHQSGIRSVDWNSKNGMITSTGNDALVNVWEPETGKILYTFKEHSWTHTVVKWSEDGSRIATGFLAKNLESQASLYSITKFPLMQGVSNNVFKITKVDFIAKNITFVDTKVGEVIDQEFLDIITYNQQELIRIDSVVINKDFDKVFAFNSSLPIEFNSTNLPLLTFQFKPQKIGVFRAEVVFYTSIGQKKVDIIGSSYVADIEVKDFDFGVMLLNSNTKKAFLSFKNITNTSIEIDSIKLTGNSNFGIIDDKTPLTISGKKGDSIEIEVYPKEVGLVQSNITFYYKDRTSKARIFAEIINPNLEVQSVLKFPDIICADSSAVNVILYNTGRGDLSIDSVNFSQGNADIFSVIKPIIFPQKIKQYDSLLLTLSFTPTIIVEKSAKMYLYNSSNNSPTTVELIGKKENTNLDINNNSTLIFKGLDEAEVADLNVPIKNLGVEKVDLSSYLNYQVGKFLVTKIGQTTLLSSDSTFMTIHFLGGKKGQTYSEVLNISNSCGKKFPLNLVANIKAEEASLAVLNTEMSLTLKPCLNSDTIIIQVFNNGKKDLVVSEVTVNNGQLGNLFKLLENSFTLASSQVYNLKLVVDPSFEGSNSLNISFKSNSYDSDINGEKNYRFEVSRFPINYVIDKQEIVLEFKGTQNPQAIPVTIYNKSVSELKLKVISDISPIKTDLPSNYILIPQTSVFQFSVFYDGNQTNQIIKKNLIFEDECGGVVTIPISVLPSNNVALRVKIEKKEINTNQELELAITLTKLENFEKSNVDEVELQFEFNKTLLTAILEENYQTDLKIVGTRAILTQKYNLNDFVKPENLQNGKLLDPLPLPSLKLFSLWGNDSLTSINLLSVLSLNPNSFPINFDSESGQVKFIDLCNKGGTRLFFDSDDSLYLDLKYDFSLSEKVSVNYNLIEKAETDIEIYNLVGEICLKQELLYGVTETSLDVRLLPNGLYFVRLHSPRQMLTKPLIIWR